MASSTEVLQRAIQAARAGRKIEARDLLLELVEIEPRNEMAWMWLSGLVDSAEDRIIACENVLTINPANEKVRVHLAELQRRYASLLAKRNNEDAVNLFNQAREYAECNEVYVALQLATQAVEKCGDYEDAWVLVARLSPDLNQQIAALEKAARLNPSNPKTASALKQLRYLRANPMDAAARLEEEGKLEEALKVYEVQAAIAKNVKDFDRIQKQVIRIKRLQGEHIHHVTPTSSIVRLIFPWPLLYLSLAFVQMGLNPVKYPNFYLWLGMPLVTIGGFLISVAEVRSHHVLWEKLFYERGSGSSFARTMTALTGWFLVLTPYILLFIDSLDRLRRFVAPHPPF